MPRRTQSPTVIGHLFETAFKKPIARSHHSFSEMSTFIIYEKFVPEETSLDGNCIWCGEPFEKNKSHILSRKIIKNNSQYNLLKKTVCTNCNSTFGSNIEDFLFKKTPLGYLADMFLHREFKTLKWIPNYYWSNALNTWVIIVHDKKANKEDVLPNQVMLDADNCLITFLNNNTNFLDKNKELIKNISADIKKDNFSTHESSKYPDNFFPRAFYLNNKLILTGINNLEINKLIQAIKNSKQEDKYSISKSGDYRFGDKYQANFKWDIKTYFDYCAKIAFEFFSLLAGRDICLESGFKDLRNSIIGNRLIKPLEVIYTEEDSRRVFSNKLVPEGWVSYVDIRVKVAIFPLVDTDQNINHSIFIYELKEGLICATVKLFNIPAVQLILGKRNPSINFRSWVIKYNIRTSEMQFFRSITDKDNIRSLTKELSGKLPKDSIITDSPNLVFKINHDKGGL
jgi:hypothetical protein